MSRRVIAFQFLLVSLLTLFISGYWMIFPESDVVTQALHVLRQMDPHYLPQDWYINNSTSYSLGYRSVYSLLMAGLASVTSLEWAYFTYYCAGLLLTPWAGYLLARYVFRAEHGAAFLSGLLLMGVHNGSVGAVRLFLTGHKETIVINLAAPLSLLVVFLFMRVGPLAGVLATATLSLLHPMIGVFTGLFALGAHLISFQKFNWETILASLGIGSLVLMWQHQPLGHDISAREFMDIYLARLPHHYLPSSFPLEEWVSFGLLQVLTLFTLVKSKPLLDPVKWKFAAAFSLLVVLACFAGFVFVEWLPLKSVMVAQTFRYLYLENSFMLILLGILVFERAKKFPETFGYLVTAVLVSAVLALCLDQGGHLAMLWLVFSIVLVELYGGGRIRLLARTVSVAALALGFLSQSEWRGPLRTALDGQIRFNWAAEKDRVAPERNWDEARTAEIYRLADFARTHTPKDAIFLTPPTFVSFRIAAERALVVDAKAISFMDPEAWRERMAAAYGFNPADVRGNFWNYLWQKLNVEYAKITTRKLAAVKEHFHATHAVLKNETPSSHPTLYQDKHYKIVELR